jgi:hypothetical protein
MHFTYRDYTGRPDDSRPPSTGRMSSGSGQVQVNIGSSGFASTWPEWAFGVAEGALHFNKKVFVIYNDQPTGNNLLQVLCTNISVRPAATIYSMAPDGRGPHPNLANNLFASSCDTSYIPRAFIANCVTMSPSDLDAMDEMNAPSLFSPRCTLPTSVRGLLSWSITASA